MLPRCATIKAVMSALHETTTLQKCEKKNNKPERLIKYRVRRWSSWFIYSRFFRARRQRQAGKQASAHHESFKRIQTKKRRTKLCNEFRSQIRWSWCTFLTRRTRPFLIVTQNKIHCSKLFVEFNRSERESLGILYKKKYVCIGFFFSACDSLIDILIQSLRRRISITQPQQIAQKCR